MPDDSAAVDALRLALATFDTAGTATVIAEIRHDRGHLIAVALELCGLLEEAIEEHDRGGAVAWIEARLLVELDAGAGTA
ncbi:hypothetical protein [Mycobacterium numidiamassiliense]|uniref:hypothetical protein n=1 Tax=Mycobacterium numidiamassiliense TaxID=1841861 RepID=UPI00097D1678|nr:hypothetical protein [Mycobacterium numidiamassiliense]